MVHTPLNQELQGIEYSTVAGFRLSRYRIVNSQVISFVTVFTSVYIPHVLVLYLGIGRYGLGAGSVKNPIVLLYNMAQKRRQVTDKKLNVSLRSHDRASIFICTTILYSRTLRLTLVARAGSRQHKH